ncbi:MAG: sulfite exporter TauE/SafE family protein [bacterium]|nr:sulfite exporter TauE/SafE family protein [bacterium]
MVDSISIVVAFTAGIISFLAPCVLPIVPGFLAYLAGSSTQSETKRRDVFLNALFFVLGFSAVFAVLGVLLNTLLSAIAYDVQIWLSRIGGIIIIFFGLYLTGILKIGFLEREHKLKIKTKFRSRFATSFAFGAAFAAGWTPCVGAALGAILGLAATQPGTALYLLFAYALGLGVPFLLVGLFAAQATRIIEKYSKYVRSINILFGILLIALGILIFTGNLARIANFELLNRFLISQ